MVETLLFRTLCVGGPLDGEHVTEAVGKEGFWYDHVAGGFEPLPDDDVMVGVSCQQAERDRYYLVEYHLFWPGCYWVYKWWKHESLRGQGVRLDTFHLSDCYVERGLYNGQVFSPSPLFRYGQVDLSVN